MIEPVKINSETVKLFLDNLKNKKYMVCFVYYDVNFGHGDIRKIDIANTYYYGAGKFNIQCRGTGYLDYIDFENIDSVKLVMKYVHSFIECVKPELYQRGTNDASI